MLEQMQMTAFQIIATVGEAKSLYMEGIYLAKDHKFDEAIEKVKEGEKVFAEAHTLHFDLVQKEANGIELPFSLMLMHAEDQMLTTETIKILAEQIISLRIDIAEL